MKVVVPAIAVFIEEGFHVPDMPLFDIVGSTGAGEFRQIGPIGVKAGVTAEVVFIVISKVVAVEHSPAFGVNVYEVVPATEVFMTDGFQVPVMPFDEVRGSGGAALFWHNGPIGGKVGVTATELFIVMLKDAVVAHSPGSGVKV